MLSATDTRRRQWPEDARERWLDRLRALSLRRLVSVGLGVAGMAALFCLAGWYLDRPITTLEVEGEFRRVSLVQVEAATQRFRGAGFLSVNLDAVRTALETIDWIDHARITRQWPDGLRVSIAEHVPAARWGEQGLLNTRGELFLRAARQVPLELPQLLGPEGTQDRVARLYFELGPQLLAVGLRLSQVELDARGSWQLTLASGVQVRLGRQDVRGRLERLVRIAGPLLVANTGTVRYIDLRYSNGFSVGWNAPARVAQQVEAAI